MKIVILVLNRITEEKQVDIGKKNYNNINTNTKETVRIFKLLLTVYIGSFEQVF